LESYELIYRHGFRSEAAAAYNTAFGMGSAVLISRSLFGLENGKIRLWLMGWVGQWEEERERVED